ncbi:HNH endonuclease [Kitasatospora kifunensis]|uniref:HNH endonuclease n=1 Tax=Kitasatospora kifunensis TaxID=58351 RepID=UPI001614BA7F|nr:HNH endonuclease [Kitasatospora kifunensis]
MPKRPCLDCGKLTTNPSRCETHQAEYLAAHNRRRGSATARGYGSKWRTVARALLARHREVYGDWCKGYRIASHASSDLTVDHIIPKANGGLDDRENLQVLCRSCNGRKRDGLA